MSEVFAITLRKVVNFSLKAKHLEIKPEGVRKHFFFIFSVLSLSFFLFPVLLRWKTLSRHLNQICPPRYDSARLPPNRLLNKNDTLINKVDSLKNKTDSLQAPPPKSDIETTIFYSARDSINSSLDTQVIKLYGKLRLFMVRFNWKLRRFSLIMKNLPSAPGES